jgi:sucrose phosphorylase
MKNQVQLITYVDRLAAGGLKELTALLDGPLAGVFGGVHLLPFFHPIDGADAGFDPIDHALVDPRLGDWTDVKALSGRAEVMADLIVNHVSAESPQFKDFREKGAASPHAGLFLTFDRVFPNGATEADLLAIYRPRPGLPFTKLGFGDGGKRMLWTTFTPQQIDIDVTGTQGEAYLDNILARFAESGVTLIRLDAAGYAIKKAGTSCFMIPETYAFIGELATKARPRGMEVLVEIHSYYKEQVEIAKRVDRVYDFALPPLLLHALYKADAAPLAAWLRISPRNAITVLDTHDGIGVIDVGADAADPAGRPGLLSPDAIHDLVETIHERTGGESRQATGAAASNLDLYQVNSTYFDALGRRETDYLIARAVQFFAPGVPQVYYVGLLGAANDMELLARTKVGRDINRHHFTRSEVEAAVETPLVTGLIDLIRFRNAHPAFAGEFAVAEGVDGRIALTWTNGSHRARLEVDFTAPSAVIVATGPDGERRLAVAPGGLKAH